MNSKQLETEFCRVFGRYPSSELECYFSPGRVCLIGEHIDYNGGLVIPTAISRGIYAVVRRTDNNVLWMHSGIDSMDVVVPIDQPIAYNKQYGWGNYPLGVVSLLQKQGVEMQGAEILFHSDLPVGSGLSSSASIQVLMGYIMDGAETDQDFIDLALLAQRTENEFIGLQCGIMDQFAVAMSKPDQALVLNCDTLAYQYLPLDLSKVDLVVFNSKKPRDLATSKYNERAAESAAALKQLQQYIELPNLAAASVEQVKQHIPEGIIRKRALHVVGEQMRVEEAQVALQQNNLEAFGKLMSESHQSLRELYEVTGFELDTLVNASISHPACLGAKMTGGGFRGCTVALVKKEASAEFIDQVLAEYTRKTGFTGEAYTVSLPGRAHQIS